MKRSKYLGAGAELAPCPSLPTEAVKIFRCGRRTRTLPVVADGLRIGRGTWLVVVRRQRRSDRWLSWTGRQLAQVQLALGKIEFDQKLLKHIGANKSLFVTYRGFVDNL